MIENFSAFMVAIVILTITPGLDTALVLRNTARGGQVDGWVSSFGICFGLFVHATLSALGVSAILAQSAQLFMVVKSIGAAYLIWLGINSLLTLRNGNGGIEVSQTGKSSLSVLRSLREGFLSNVLNPKTAVFYLAFLPQFMNQESSLFAQAMLMAAIHFMVAMVWQCSLASMLDKATQWLKSDSVAKWTEGITGAVLLTLGISLFLEDSITTSAE